VNTDETFLRAILANPSDGSLPLVYADWLDERGDPRAASIRQHPDAYAFLVQLQNTPATALTLIENCAAQGRFAFLASLAVVVEGHRNHEEMKPVISDLGDTIFHHITRVLAQTASKDSLDAFLKAYAANPGHVSWGRELASRTAASPLSDLLLSLFDQPPQDPNVRELLACMLQELARLRLRPTSHVECSNHSGVL
jgi:uncharacterized protein (TIGR02996 family)